MANHQLTTTPAIVDMQEKWLEAKKAEAEWREYRLALENQILESLKATGIVIPEAGTLKLEKLNVTFGVTRTWSETDLAQMAGTHPHLIGSTLLVEYKVAITKPKVDRLIREGTEIGLQLAECFEDKAKKPSFASR